MKLPSYAIFYQVFLLNLSLLPQQKSLIRGRFTASLIQDLGLGAFSNNVEENLAKTIQNTKIYILLRLSVYYFPSRRQFFKISEIISIILQRKARVIRMKDHKNRTINIDDIIIKLTQSPFNERSFPIRQGQIEGLCYKAKSIFLDQPMLLELEAPVQICGDTHGQFQDLLSVFKLMGTPAQRNYLFLGDYVDRGKQSLECICLLIAYKIKFPQSFFLLRGNHQSSQLNKLYGFYDECKRRSSIKTFKLISDSFNSLPIAAVVGGRIFCVHGGISPLIKNLSSLNAIKRPIECMQNKVLSDMMWADPKTTIQGWADNVERGISYYYGKNAVQQFLKRNQFDLICRSHQVVEQGYQFAFNRKLITIFSAPNYCGQFTNLGAILRVSQGLMCHLDQFEGKPVLIQSKSRCVTPVKINVNSPIKPTRQDSVKKQRKATNIPPYLTAHFQK